MYHSITIGEKNTWDDWKLIPLSRPVVKPPEVVTKYVEIPGYDGSVDLTELLTGRPTYSRRVGDWKFMVTNNYDGYDWQTLYSSIMNYLHGEELEVRLEDDPDYFYTGRLSVSGWDSGKSYSTITIGYELMPFKLSNISSIDEWLWDDFNFETGVIRDYGGLRVDGELSIRIIGGDKSIVPDIAISAPMEITYNGFTENYESAGVYHAVDLAIIPGENTMTFKGTGEVSVIFRGGSL